MKKVISMILLCGILSALLAGCGDQAAANKPQTAIGNPWTEWNTLEEAESAVGFSFGLPEEIAKSYEAVSFQTMNGELLEVRYLAGEFEVCVRKQAGEGQDISGDYNKYDRCREKIRNGAVVTEYSNSDSSAVRQTVSFEGYSWSLVAPNGWREDSAQDFMSEILGQ